MSRRRRNVDPYDYGRGRERHSGSRDDLPKHRGRYGRSRHDALNALQKTEVNTSPARTRYHVDTADDERLWTFDGATNSSRWTLRDLSGKVLRDFTFDWVGGTAALDYMHARYYTGRVGRFLSVDPTWQSAYLQMPQSWNRYSYALNNPINFTDPTGMKPCTMTLPDGTEAEGECIEVEAEADDVEPVPSSIDWVAVLEPVADIMTGFADTITFDATRKLREHMGDDQVVNPCSDWYTGGQIAGVVWWGAAGGAVGGRIGGNTAARELGNLTLTNSQYAARGLAGLSDAQKLAAMGGVGGGIAQALKNAVTPSWWGAILKTTATTTPTPGGWGGLVGLGVGGASAGTSQASNDC